MVYVKFLYDAACQKIIKIDQYFTELIRIINAASF